jgi:hypothetical protein
VLRPGWTIGMVPLAASEPLAFAAGPGASSPTRREPRSSTQLTFAACGLSSGGRFFIELCSTLNVSRSGCCLRLHTQPQNNSALVLRAVPGGTALPQGTSQLLFQLAWIRPVEDGWRVGAFALSKVDLLRLASPFSTPLIDSPCTKKAAAIAKRVVRFARDCAPREPRNTDDVR